MHVVLPNQSLAAVDHSFSTIWRLTRALLKAGVRYVASSDGTSKDTSSSPASDLWAGSGGSVGSGATASLTTLDRGRITLTGVTGLTSAHEGNFMTITGAASGGNNGTFQISSVTSATEAVLINASAVASDANNGAISWSHYDPTAQTYPSALDSVSAWWFCYGVPTVRVPVNTFSSGGSFRIGERVSQSTSNAVGEIIGFLYDSATPANSYLVVLPRLGTFDGNYGITGTISGATITPSGSPVTFQSELVFWKANNTHSGSLYYSRVTSTDTTLASLLSSSGCTATVAPGGGGTGNSFPATATAVAGTGGSASHLTWLFTTTVGNGKSQIVAANMIPSDTESADGTFWIMHGMPSLGATESHGFGLFRCDDPEDGDVDPFLWYYPGNFKTRTSNTGSINTGGVWSSRFNIYDGTAGNFHGWRRRGFTSGDGFLFYLIALLRYFTTGAAVIVDTFGTPETVSAHTQTVYVREPVWGIAQGTTKGRKGTLRWMGLCPTGTAYSTWGSRQWVQVYEAASFYPGIVLGPWDGVTDPVQS